MNNDIEKKYLSGWDFNFGQILFVFVVGSILVSLLESAFLRRACFCHIGLFGISVLLGAVGCFVRTLPGIGPVGAVWGLWIHLVLAIGLFATSAMLSPIRDVGSDRD